MEGPEKRKPYYPLSPEEKKAEEEENTRISRRNFLKKIVVAGGVLATGGLLGNLLKDKIEKDKKEEREHTHIGTGTISRKEIHTQPGGVVGYVSRPTTHQFLIYIKIGQSEGELAVSRDEYDSLKEGQILTVEYISEENREEIEIKSITSQ